MEQPVFDHRKLGLDDVFEFACYPGISCFNICCFDVTLVLGPYDFLRLRKNLGLSSREFIDRFCDFYIGDVTQLPVVSVKMQSHDFSCPFLREEGCSVYPDRPASCRTYPLARFVGRDEEGKPFEIYRIIRETHCKGHFEKRPISVRDWIKEQGLEPYYEFNDLFGEIVFARQHMDRPLTAEELDLIYLACYGLEKFKEYVSSQAISLEGFSQDEIAAALKDDEKLLRLGLNFLKKTIFRDYLPQ
ncbi:YkgJ family cysteine cluster protein [Thermodesulfatator atlanticus]|uniref:YkgJ family cysteine cluster protein n=1 Tax=Thermodesulfatator atlanticus TaxID=501497 RepID=UPI0003B3F74F|nr:YkgJ family cysteine cluster protein [Thermodesulfatator atlanticus]